ncbi:uncharacterized protein LOC123536329 [Mercenaria mercenaria]|uniref:uncharacterized protein LOC123536329 n=1 Tax=Mercenaria mercenaria TaxID=6596 RepID=UPI00234F87A0|nr:uncharacterized protein LOC123536329 [Mercenaria mercenaria]
MDPHGSIERHKGRFVKKVLKKKSDFLKTSNKLKHSCDYGHVPERRIVDMKYFGEIFDKGCKSCKRHFLFKDIIAENIYGLCSLVKFKCSKCRQETTISTSRASGETDKTLTKSPYSVNLKAAIGMIHAGIGETHMNGFLVTLGIPPIHHKTLKKHEQKVGKVMVENARDSCARACEEEKAASQACMLPATVTERGDGDNIRDTFLHEPNTDRVAADDKEIYAADDTDTDQITFDETMAMLEEYDYDIRHVI